MMQSDKIVETALGWHLNAGGAVLAIVMQTWGAAPCPVGSVMAIRGDGVFAGSVSGGCVETAVIAEALMLQDKFKILTYGVDDGDAFAAGLACGGTISILLARIGAALPVDIVQSWADARTARQGVVIEFYLKGNCAELSKKTSDTQFSNEVFTLNDPAPLHLVITGAVHIAQHLIPMAKACHFAITLIDPRPVFTDAARFDGVQICTDWPDQAFKTIPCDSRTAVAALTHHAKFDDPTLQVALDSDAFYIGVLGSKCTHMRRIERLKDHFDTGQIARIHGPIGLDIGAKGPAQIAVSIMAEIIAHMPTGGQKG